MTTQRELTHPSQQEIEQQQELLEAHRGGLMMYLKQQAILGEPYTPPAIPYEIREKRAHICRIKNILRAWGVHVADHPDDGPCESPPEPATAPFFVPFRVNRVFFGREHDLEVLDQMLKEPKARPIGICGMGGVGKTQLAAEYCHRYRDNYADGIFWIDATRPLHEGFALLSERRGQAIKNTDSYQAARAAWTYLDAHPGALAVFDDIPSPATLNSPFMPDYVAADLRCRILFTTRRPDVTPFRAIEVTRLPEEQALQLLLYHRNCQAILDPAHPQHGAARAICAFLGYLPLALEIAAAHLSHDWPVPVGAYYRKLIECGALLVLDDPQGRVGSDYLPTGPATAISAILASQWQTLEQKADVRKLLRVAGQLLKAGSIPIAHLGLLANLDDQTEGFVGSALTRALQDLIDAELIEPLKEERIRLHPLVHEFAAQITPKDQRESFRHEIADNVRNQLKIPTRRHDIAVLAGECLLELGWSKIPVETRTEVLDALRELIEKQSARRNNRSAAPTLLERIARYADLSEDRSHLVESITAVLSSHAADMPAHQRIQLLINRAAALVQLRDLGRARADYDQAQLLIDQYAPTHIHAKQDRKLQAQIKLGRGRIIQIQAETEKDPEPVTDLLKEAIKLYREASRLAKSYGQDIILRAGIYIELSYAYALLEEWKKAEEHYGRALGVLDTEAIKVVDPVAYHTYYTLTLETASQIHYLKGQKLAPRLPDAKVLAEYHTAYKLVEQEIAKLEESFGESEGLAIALSNAGDYLQAMSEYSDCPIHDPMGQADKNWRTALEMAHHLNLAYLVTEISQRLDPHTGT
ncbi:MAG: NB-ARC domain-containing protein [Roseiflexaceae bacterium]